MNKLKNRAKFEGMPHQLYYTLCNPKHLGNQPQNKMPFNPIKRQMHKRG